MKHFWWKNRDNIEDDPQLRRLRNQLFIHEHDLEQFDYRKQAVYTLRGPRQVGKTTLLKQIIEYLLKTKNYHIRPRDILYVNVQAIAVSTPHDLQELLQKFIVDRRAANQNQLYIFLDEVTGITDWGQAIQALRGRGILKQVFVMATGSHALDIKRGGERMPGWRGDVDEPDWILMPLSFRDYVSALGKYTEFDLPDQLPEIDLFDIEMAGEQAVDLEMYSPPINVLFQRYLRTGGYPYAISSELKMDQIPRRVYLQFQQSIREEMRRAGRKESYFRELVAWAVDKHLGDEFSWSGASGDTHIGSKNTVRDYFEDREAVFIWQIMYRVINIGDPTPAPKSPKKLYTVDPFCWHALTAWVRGIQNPWENTLENLTDKNFLGKFVESVVADHFKRRFGPFSLYHRTSQGKEEIDFILHQDPDVKSLVEVKYRNRIKRADRKYLKKSGGGILATQDQIEYHEDINVADIPVYTLLAGLPYDLTLYPARD